MLEKSERSKDVLRPRRESIYFMVAEAFSQRSTCLRKKVGACLVRDGHILGTGYNGAPRHEDDCVSSGCAMVDDHCVRTVHAEVNAVLSAAYNGVSTKDSILYTTVKPCFRCEAFLINAGVSKVYFLYDYDDGRNGKTKLDIEVYGKEIS